MIGKQDKEEQPAQSPEPETGALQDGGLIIVGVGASAGGLESFEQFFRNTPPDSGMAFVLVPHLDPSHASTLTEILQRTTAMPVVQAQDRMAVAPNRVYVLPPNRDMAIFHGALQLSVPDMPRGQRMPIDVFLRSLAEEQGERAIGVIFSGTGTDGTLGLRAILGVGGVSLVQDPATAKYDGMPNSAIRSGFATYVLPIDRMPPQLLAYAKTLSSRQPKPPTTAPLAASDLSKVLMLLRSATGHDFSFYKRSTIGRRVERRMTVHGIDGIDVYTRYLKEHPAEVQLLFKELLINVSSFFRDPEAFAALKQEILPRLFEGKPEDHVFRVWVAACATGEEAYSIAIALREHMDELQREYKVQIYATDIDDEAIAQARAGVYPPNVATDVSADRLRRFFVKDDAGYRVKKQIRETIVFAVQNVIKDPPFTRLDLVSCRNLLIYLEPELQRRIIPTFHYALKPGGVLLLSSSESIGNEPELFAVLNRKWKIYQAIGTVASSRKMMADGLAWARSQLGRAAEELVKKTTETTDFAELTRRALLHSYAPASVLTDERGTIFYVHGDSGKFLRPAPGYASLNVVDMARAGLQRELRGALRTAAVEKTSVVCNNLPLETGDGVASVDLAVRPLLDSDAVPGLLIVSFQEVTAPGKRTRTKHAAGKTKHAASKSKTRRVQELEHALAHTQENLQTIIEEQQASNEELKSANEELQSTNEELQSTNEELETSKEEMQSINEELITVNAELHAKIEQLIGIQNDMKNLLDSTDIGTIFLDTTLAIKRFTRESAAIYRLVASDVGRALGDIKSNIEADDLIAHAQAVLDSLVPREKEVCTSTGERYVVRILPYRTIENVIDGVVLTFTEITKRVEAEHAVREAREFAEGIVDTVREPLLVLGAALQIVSANRSFYQTFRATPEETIGHPLAELGDRQWDIPRLHELLGTVLRENTSFEDIDVEHEFPAIGRRKMLLNARSILGREGKTKFILLAIEDVTHRSPAMVDGPV